MVPFVDDISSALNNAADIMHFDFANAFDSVQSCLIFMRTIARKRLVLFYRCGVEALNLRMNQMSKV